MQSICILCVVIFIIRERERERPYIVGIYIFCCSLDVNSSKKTTTEKKNMLIMLMLTNI